MKKTSKFTSGQSWQMIKFLLFSVSAGVIQIISFELLGLFTPLAYSVKYIIALVLSVVWNFTFNRRYTFRSDANIPKAMSLVFLFYLVFTPTSTILGDWAVQKGCNETLALLGSMVLNFVLEYLYQRYVVYRRTVDTNDIAKRHKEEQ